MAYCSHICARCGGGVSHYVPAAECREPETLEAPKDSPPLFPNGGFHPDCIIEEGNDR